MNRAVTLGAACCALAAAAGVYLGEAFGVLVPLVAAVLGGSVLGLSLGTTVRGAESAPAESGPEAARAADPSAAGAAECPQASATGPADPAPLVAQGPAETHEVQLKLDLARSYLEMDEAGLAIPLLQEILETELAVAARLESDALRETR